MGVANFVTSSVVKYLGKLISPITGTAKSVRAFFSPSYAAKLAKSRNIQSAMNKAFPGKFVSRTLTNAVKIGVGALAVKGVVKLARNLFTGPNLNNLSPRDLNNGLPGMGTSMPRSLGNTIAHGNQGLLKSQSNRDKNEIAMKLAAAKGDKMLYEKAAMGARIPHQSSPDTLNKIYSNQADPNDKLDKLIELLNQQAQIQNDTRKVNLAQLQTEINELKLNSERSGRLYNSLMQLQIQNNSANREALAESTRQIESSNRMMASTVSQSTQAIVGKTLGSIAMAGMTGYLTYQLLSHFAPQLLSMTQWVGKHVGNLGNTVLDALGSITGNGIVGIGNSRNELNEEEFEDVIKDKIKETGSGAQKNLYTRDALRLTAPLAGPIASEVKAIKNAQKITELEGVIKKINNQKLTKAFEEFKTNPDTDRFNWLKKVSSEMKGSEAKTLKTAINNLDDAVTPITQVTQDLPKESRNASKGKTSKTNKGKVGKVEKMTKKVYKNTSKLVEKYAGKESAEKIATKFGTKCAERIVKVRLSYHILKSIAKGVSSYGLGISTVMGLYLAGKRLAAGQDFSTAVGSALVGIRTDVLGTVSAAVSSTGHVVVGTAMTIGVITWETSSEMSLDMEALDRYVEDDDYVNMISYFEFQFSEVMSIVYGNDVNSEVTRWIEFKNYVDRTYRSIYDVILEANSNKVALRSLSLGMISLLNPENKLYREWLSKWDDISVYETLNWMSVEILVVACFWRKSKLFQQVFESDEFTTKIINYLKSNKLSEQWWRVMHFILTRNEVKSTKLAKKYDSEIRHPDTKKHVAKRLTAMKGANGVMDIIGSSYPVPQDRFNEKNRRAEEERQAKIQMNLFENEDKEIREGNLNLNAELSQASVESSQGFLSSIKHGWKYAFDSNYKKTTDEFEARGIRRKDFSDSQWETLHKKDFENTYNSIKKDRAIQSKGTTGYGNTDAGANYGYNKNHVRGNGYWNIKDTLDYLNRNYNGPYIDGVSGHCARAVRSALNYGGLSVPVGHAYTYFEGNENDLSKYGFSKINLNEGLKSPQVGDVIVENKTNHEKNQWGHIQIWDGKQWRSDFKQNSPLAHVHTVGEGKKVYFRYKGVMGDTVPTSNYDYSSYTPVADGFTEKMDSTGGSYQTSAKPKLNAQESPTQSTPDSTTNSDKTSGSTETAQSVSIGKVGNTDNSTHNNQSYVTINNNYVSDSYLNNVQS